MTSPTPEQPHRITQLIDSTLEVLNNPQVQRFLKIFAIGSASIAVVGSSILVFQAITKPPEKATVPLPEPVALDPSWLTDSYWILRDRRTITDAYEQMNLWLNNDDPNRGQLGVINTEQSKEAQRYRAAASTFTSKPGHPCDGKPEEYCLTTFAKNIQSDLEKAKTPTQRIEAYIQYLALNEARFGTPQGIGIPNNALGKRVVEKFESDLALFYDRGTANGISNSVLGQSLAQPTPTTANSTPIQDDEQVGQ